MIKSNSYAGILQEVEHNLKETQNGLLDKFKTLDSFKKYLATNKHLDEFFEFLDAEKDSHIKYISFIKITLILMDDNNREMKRRLAVIKTWPELKEYLLEEKEVK